MKKKFSLSMLLAFSFAFLAGCAQVQTQKINDKVYAISTLTEGGADSFSNYDLKKQAELLCPKGYNLLSQSMTKQAELPKSGIECLEGKNCSYQLSWRLICVVKPKEPFSLFGKH